MCQNPQYFSKTKHGVYQFRYSFPQSIYKKFGIRREMKISLRTKTRRIAIARHYTVLKQVHSIIEELIAIDMSDTPISRKTIDDIIEHRKAKIVLEDLTDANESIRLELIAAKAEIERSKESLRTKDRTIEAILARQVETPSNVRSSLTIKEAIAQYFELQVEKQTWSDKIKSQRKGYFGMFADIIGQDEDISILSNKTITGYQRVLRKLPKNVNKLYDRPTDYSSRPAHYRHIAKVNDHPLLAARGLESHFNTVKPFLTWCVQCGYIKENLLHLLSIGKSEIRKTEIKVLPFSNEHLNSMFISYIYSDARITREKPNPFQFWLPLIGLWTGARLNELATLLLSDIKEIDGILCFDINDNGEGKTLKSVASRRSIPIASVIQKAGFKVYLEQRTRASHGNNDFPLFDLPDHVQGVSRAVSKWFNENFKKKCGLTTPKNTKVVFHSFRHTFINKMQSTKLGDTLIPNRVIQEIVGHETGEVTNDVYGENHEYAVLKEAIDSLDFGIDFEGVTYSRFQRRKKI